jgi:hypothetical protein
MNAFAKATTIRRVLRNLALGLLTMAICLTASIPAQAAKKNNGGKKKLAVSSQEHPKKDQGKIRLANNGKPK